MSTVSFTGTFVKREVMSKLASGMARNQFKKLLVLCVTDNHFIFNKEHFMQYEGFAMGSPLSATMANLFLCHHETKWLDDCPESFRPLVYRRYVDDTFLAFRKRDHIDAFCNYLNGKHPNIKFTKEYEDGNKLSFLDMNVNKIERESNVAFNFSIFRKATFTSLGMSYHSYCFYNFKINNIKTLIFRAFKLCSTWHNFDDEVKFLLSYFKINGYPEGIVYKVIHKFLNSLFYPKPCIATVRKLPMYIKFPFISNMCCKLIQAELGKLVRIRYPYIDFRFIFVNNTTIQGLLNHKERLPGDLLSGLVYTYSCDACGATYIGQTKRCLRTRIGEHFGRSTRTGYLLARPSPSAVRDHIEICGSRRSVDDFKCVRSFSNEILCTIYESLEILYKKPSLNQDGSSFPLLLI